MVRLGEKAASENGSEAKTMSRGPGVASFSLGKLLGRPGIGQTSDESVLNALLCDEAQALVPVASDTRKA